MAVNNAILANHFSTQYGHHSVQHLSVKQRIFFLIVLLCVHLGVRVVEWLRFVALLTNNHVLLRTTLVTAAITAVAM